METQNNPAEVKASSPIRTSLYEREGSMWGRLKRPSPRRTMIEECRSDDSDFCQELLSRYGFTPEEMHRAAERYHLGRSKSGKTIYWMIDDFGICRDGHIGNSWVSQMLKARYPDLAQYVRPCHCLFGLHLLGHTESTESTENFKTHTDGTDSTDIKFSKSKILDEQSVSSDKSVVSTKNSSNSCNSWLWSKTIGVVESERSAVILSEARPELLWLAYAYPLNLTVNLFEPLQGCTVTLFPRTDPNQDNYYASLDFADQVRRKYHLDFRVSKLLEDNATPAQKAAQIDLVDFIMDKSR